MKLVIQIPCFSEKEALPITLRELPKQIDGIDKVECLVIDDGSTDGTAEVATELGVDHIIKFAKNHGLARAFSAGLDASLKLGADIIVNTDADNQYSGNDIPKLIRPILEGKADMVIGERSIRERADFSWPKKLLQRLGSWVVRMASGTDVPDAPCGFRAFSREAALQLNVLSDYTYTLETIIQAGRKNIAVASVPIRTNPPLRKSRLIRSTLTYLLRSASTILRIFVIYKPLRFFGVIGLTLLSLGFLIGLRFLYFYITGDGQGHVQSLILAAALSIIGFQLTMIGFLADLIAANRKLVEDIQYRVRKLGCRNG